MPTPAHQLYAVAALIAPAQAWAALQTPWHQVLRSADPKREIFHRADLYSPYGEPYCRWDDAKRARVLADVARLLGCTTKYAVTGVLLKDEYDSFCGRHGRPLGATPYELCPDACIGFVSKWLEDNDLRSERAAYFFEAGDREHGGSGQFNDSIQRIISRSARYREEMRIAWVSFVPKRDAPALQTADLLAYEFTHCRLDVGELTQTLRTLASTFPIQPVYLDGELFEDLASRYTDGGTIHSGVLTGSGETQANHQIDREGPSYLLLAPANVPSFPPSLAAKRFPKTLGASGDVTL